MDSVKEACKSPDLTIKGMRHPTVISANLRDVNDRASNFA